MGDLPPPAGNGFRGFAREGLPPLKNPPTLTTTNSAWLSCPSRPPAAGGLAGRGSPPPREVRKSPHRFKLGVEFGVKNTSHNKCQLSPNAIKQFRKQDLETRLFLFEQHGSYWILKFAKVFDSSVEPKCKMLTLLLLSRGRELRPPPAPPRPQVPR